MENKSDIRPARRVGTFTLGITLVLCGMVMLLSMFLTGQDNIEALVTWGLKLSPLILIGLGTETLLAARSGGPVKYDWLGMVLCFVLICAALGLYALAWLLRLGIQEYGYLPW